MAVDRTEGTPDGARAGVAATKFRAGEGFVSRIRLENIKSCRLANVWIASHGSSTSRFDTYNAFSASGNEIQQMKKKALNQSRGG